MLHAEFPVPVSVLTDETRHDAHIYIHRHLKGFAHEDGPECSCCPHHFTHDEIQRVTLNQLNELLRAEIN
jgi:hypothetical protein